MTFFTKCAFALHSKLIKLGEEKNMKGGWGGPPKKTYCSHYAAYLMQHIYLKFNLQIDCHFVDDAIDILISKFY